DDSGFGADVDEPARRVVARRSDDGGRDSEQDGLLRRRRFREIELVETLIAGAEVEPSGRPALFGTEEHHGRGRGGDGREEERRARRAVREPEDAVGGREIESGARAVGEEKPLHRARPRRKRPGLFSRHLVEGAYHAVVAADVEPVATNDGATVHVADGLRPSVGEPVGGRLEAPEGVRAGRGRAAPEI